MGNKPATQKSPTTSGIQRKYLNEQNVLTYSKDKIVQNFILIWLDSTIGDSGKDFQYTISQLRKIVNSITLFIDSDACCKFIEKTRDEQIFLIVSGKLGKTLVPLVHKYVRLDTIYIFCGQPLHHRWTENWKKIQLVSDQIERICQSLVKDTSQCEQDLTPTSILSSNDSSNQNLAQVNSSFMYSQLIKEILLEMTYDERAIEVLVDFCRNRFQDNQHELKIIEEFQKDYRKYSPIWWYTRECFTYKMLNRGLRTFNINIISVMGFFMKDIHQQIKEIHSKRSNRMGPFIVYRGQGMLNDEFIGIRNNIGGLLSFNSFLSTSDDLKVAMEFAQRSVGRPGKTSVLFEIEVDPTLTSTPFASLNNVTSSKEKEKETLFSMHTVFQIVQVKEDNNQIWKIILKLVSNNNLQITQLTEQIRREIGEGSAIDRLGRLMIALGELEKAEAIYELLCELTSENDKKTVAWIRNQSGYIKYKQEQYSEAQAFYKDAREIQEKMRPSTDIDLAVTYSNMGLLYTNLNDTSNALLYHQKALEIREKNLKVNHQDLATTYNNIGLVYYQRQEFSTALSYYEKTLKIYQQILPANHSWLATTYKNIGLAQISKGEHTTGLDNLCKAMDIRKMVLPPNHPSIASICSTIGEVYRETKEYPTALKFYEEALVIEKNAPQINYSSLAMTYYKISRILSELKRHDSAAKYAELAVQSASKSSTPSDNDKKIYKDNFERLQTKLS
ncbi:unnamed protein product [Rotaria sp. Silwood2]|nr:unnamed protein product [Rotaria sp. Silwood2]CAF3061936.1 unnamed protein product [Rotaria sp. Silwood2]CAF4078757.1 unnamed protein product [Rotaria sp. Silwood2]CAF4380010.1 unnamed protein product [Rotaria sp. Silwood2]